MNPFEWMPKPGESKKLPNGMVIWCQQWKTHRNHGSKTIEGEITFNFFMHEADYVRYTEEQDGMDKGKQTTPMLDMPQT